jgi:hypothetical protein
MSREPTCGAGAVSHRSIQPLGVRGRGRSTRPHSATSTSNTEMPTPAPTVWRQGLTAPPALLRRGVHVVRFALGCVVTMGVLIWPLGSAVADRLPGSDHGGLPESDALVGVNQVPPLVTAGFGADLDYLAREPGQEFPPMPGGSGVLGTGSPTTYKRAKLGSEGDEATTVTLTHPCWRAPPGFGRRRVLGGSRRCWGYRRRAAGRPGPARQPLQWAGMITSGLNPARASTVGPMMGLKVGPLKWSRPRPPPRCRCW